MDHRIDLSVPGFSDHEGFRVVPADTEALKACVYRFRYYVDVTILKKKHIHADHSRGAIRDPLDTHGVNYVVINDGRMVGAVRRNKLVEAQAASSADVYAAHLFDRARADRMAITTMPTMLPENRGTKSAIHLMSAYARHCYKAGVEVDLIVCDEPSIPFFERLGYLAHSGWTFHRDSGRVRPMFLAWDAVNYMHSILSPLSSAAREHVYDDQYGGYDLIRRLAHGPTLGSIRLASAQYRRAIPKHADVQS